MGDGRRQERSRSPGKGKGKGKGKDRGKDKGKAPVHQVTIENLPDDMGRAELKELGQDYGSSVTYARTYFLDRVNCGLIEFQDKYEADMAVKELDDRRIEGSRGRLRAYHGPGNSGS